MSAEVILLVVLGLCLLHSARTEVDEGHSEWEYVLCMQKEGLRTSDTYGVKYNAEIVEYSCVENYLYFATTSKPLNAIQTTWLNELYAKYQREVDEARSGNFQIRLRKEYRMLTVNERTTFNQAVTAFKSDRAQFYDALTSLHVGETSRAAHRGPAFLAWNRIFLCLFELALREYQSDVVLPYWDNTLDSQLDHPTDSLIWSPDYAGNGNGRVVSGPFARWNILGRDLIRNTGESGRLMKSTDVTSLLTSSPLISDITFPNAFFLNNLELHSYGVRLWVGGDMALLETATNDPMYFLLGAYIDNLWQQFRDWQEVVGVNPQVDYPIKFDGYAAHFPNARIGVFPGIGNRAALRDVYGKLMHQYVQPSCSPDGVSCGTTGALRCNTTTNQCQAVASEQSVDSSCVGSNGYQNSYCLDESNCDERDWVYLPIEVIYTRPFGYSYPSKPFTSASAQSPYDVYSTKNFSSSGHYSQFLTYSNDYAAPQVEQCPCPSADTGRVYAQSYGLNYRGTYREYSITDKRLPTSSVWTHVAIKDPRDSTDFQVRALIRVYDDCGRICRTFCRVTGTTDYAPCSGVVTASTTEPREYSSTLEDMIYVLRDYGQRTVYPQPKRDLTILKFVCDQSALWPWLLFGYIADPYKAAPTSPGDPDPGDPDLFTTTTTTTPAPTTTTVTTTTTTQPTTTRLIKPLWCFNATECFIEYEPTNCTRCEHHTFKLCWDHCQKYLHCSKGIWYVKSCADGLLWDDGDNVKTCNYRHRVECRPGGDCTGCKPQVPDLTRGRTRS